MKDFWTIYNLNTINKIRINIKISTNNIRLTSSSINIKFHLKAIRVQKTNLKPLLKRITFHLRKDMKGYLRSCGNQ